MAKRALIVLSAVVASLATAAPTLAAPPPDRTGTVTPAAPFTWTGPTTTAANTQFDPSVAEPCGKTAADYCDTTLVNVVPGDFYSAPGRGIEFRTAPGAGCRPVRLRERRQRDARRPRRRLGGRDGRTRACRSSAERATS